MSEALQPSPTGEALRSETESTFRRLRWVALVAPLAMVALVEVLHTVGPLISPWTDLFLAIVLALIVSYALSQLLFRRMKGLQRRLLRQNRELLMLHSAGLRVVSDLSLETVLQKVVDNASELIGARYGALSIVDSEGEIQSFLTSGITPQLREAIGSVPEGRGLLGVVLHQGEHLRLSNISQNPRSVGFPPHHPSMTGLLAVPVPCETPWRGNLYLSEKHDGTDFTAGDEETLVRFATQAAIAIDNAYLHGQVRELAVATERLRIAHEIHDGVAQLLAYVNTKAQAVTEYLKQQKVEEAQLQLAQLAEASRQAYRDLRAHILELRSSVPESRELADALREFVDNWRDLTEVDVEITIDEPLQLPGELELQLMRIVQEALTNVRKHSQASKVWIEVEQRDDHLRAVVADDGIGFRPEVQRSSKSPRFGLATMRERAAAVGGRLEVDSSTQGTKIIVELPTKRLREALHATHHR